MREEVTANTCFSTAAKVREKVDSFFFGLAKRAVEIVQRCLRELQALVDYLLLPTSQTSAKLNHVYVDFTLRLV